MLHDQVIDQTVRLVHFRAGSSSASSLGRMRKHRPVLIVAIAWAICVTPGPAHGQRWRLGTITGGGIFDGGGAAFVVGAWTQRDLRYLGVRLELALGRTGGARHVQGCYGINACFEDSVTVAGWQLEIPVLLALPLPTASVSLLLGLTPRWRLWCDTERVGFWIVGCSHSAGVDIPLGISYRPGRGSPLSIETRAQLSISKFATVGGRSPETTYHFKASRICLALTLALWSW